MAKDPAPVIAGRYAASRTSYFDSDEDGSPHLASQDAVWANPPVVSSRLAASNGKGNLFSGSADEYYNKEA